MDSTAVPPPKPSGVTKSNTEAGSLSSMNSHHETLASCTLCRRRKVKCDRSNPCGYCLRVGAECVPSVPLRMPRGRQGGRKRKRTDEELLERISKLEDLVKEIEKNERAAKVQDITTVGSRDVASTISGDGQGGFANVAVPSEGRGQLNWSSGKTEQGARAESDQSQATMPRLDRYVGTSFWMALSDEISGLKDVLGGTSDEEEEGHDRGTPALNLPSSRRQQSNHSGFVISRTMSTESPSYPTRHQVHTFCDVYLANVDPVFKILHGPSLRRYLQEDAVELDCSPGVEGREALKFAIYYAATSSLTEWECRQRIGEDKAVLLLRYRIGTELSLAKADFVNTVETSTLQALVIYLVSVRANDNTRLSWTLTSLAVRIAQAMGLHYDSTLCLLQPLEREMGRRLWWQICVLDSRAAGDRASDPVVTANSFNTKLPLHINDEDLRSGSSEEVKERDSFTDMTFCLICQEVFDVERQLNYVPARELGQPQARSKEIWNQRISTVINMQRRIEDRYLRHLNVTRPFQWATRMVADIITATMWLMVYRPLQRRPESVSSSAVPDPGILRLSVEVLEKAHQINTDPAASPLRWLSHTYVQWHALAVTTAELCVKTEGPVVERAWAILEPTYKETAQHVADSNQGMLWRPIKKLMNKAQGVRQKYLDSRSAIADLSATKVPLAMSGQMSPLANTADAMYSINDFTMETIDGDIISTDAVQQLPSTSTFVPFDWDPWLAMAAMPSTMGPTSQGQYSDDTNHMAWMNWRNFVDDIQVQDDVISSQSAFM